MIILAKICSSFVKLPEQQAFFIILNGENMKELPDTVVIVGAGPSGLFAARQLKMLATEQKKEISIIVLEREDVVGGKCRTYSDPENHELKTEWGAALLAPNYGVVLDAVKEHHLEFEMVLPAQTEDTEFTQYHQQQSFLQKFSLARAVAQELYTFNQDYAVYKQAKQQKTPLPEYLQQPFSEYAEAKGMKVLPLFAKLFVPGFGYGAITHCPTYSILEYFGKMTVPDIMLSETLLRQPPLLSIKGGFQLLMEKIAAGFEVRTKVDITKIERNCNNNDGIRIHYQQNGMEHVLSADALILATSPLNWPKMGLDLTEVEKNCVEQLEYYRYPVAVCKIKGLPPKQQYFSEALNEDGFGHLALITTRDNRTNPEDGRLCTIYVNLPPGKNDYQIDQDTLCEEIKKIEGVTKVEFIEEKTWEDYMSTLPWDLRLKLDKEKHHTKTHYLGSFALGSFEDVVCVGNLATDEMRQSYSPSPSFVEDDTVKNMSRAWQFFSADVYPPVDSTGSEKNKMSRCIIQ